MDITDMGYVVASRYNVILVSLSRQQSFTFFPLRSWPPANSSMHRMICVGHVFGSHFVQVHWKFIYSNNFNYWMIWFVRLSYYYNFTYNRFIWKIIVPYRLWRCCGQAIPIQRQNSGQLLTWHDNALLVNLKMKNGHGSVKSEAMHLPGPCI